MLVHDWLVRAESLYARRLAVSDGAARYSYAEFAHRTRRCAAGLAALGLGAESTVACLSGNDHRMMEVVFAASLAGCPVTPLNTRLAAPEIAFMLRDSGAQAVFTAKAYLPLLDSIAGQLPRLKALLVFDGGLEPVQGSALTRGGYESWLARSAPWSGASSAWRNDRMYLLCYTGGTTGRPKGVMLSQENVVSNALHAIQMMELSGRDVWLHAAPMFHLADLWSCFSMTALGGCHVFMERFDAAQALALIESEHVTATSIVPTMILMLLQETSSATRELRSLRRVLYGAAPMPVAPLREAIGRFGPVLQQGYGLTEAAPFLAATPGTDLRFPNTETGIARLASCGQPVLGVALRIVDAAGRVCAADEVGEVQARGPNIMLGYWQRPEETRAAFADGWLRTGDLGRRDEEGYLFIVDRAKDVVISGGENVYSAEVENALYQHPAILEAAVVGKPDPRWGEVVHAVVVLKSSARATPEELILHCQSRIARYKCPKSVEIRAALPKSGAGKILKAALRADLKAPADA